MDKGLCKREKTYHLIINYIKRLKKITCTYFSHPHICKHRNTYTEGVCPTVIPIVLWRLFCSVLCFPISVFYKPLSHCAVLCFEPCLNYHVFLLVLPQPFVPLHISLIQISQSVCITDFCYNEFFLRGVQNPDSGKHCFPLC